MRCPCGSARSRRDILWSGAVIYEGNGDGAADFELNVSESGEYTVEVEGHQAAGKISVKVLD